MIARIIVWSVHQRALVLTLAVLLALAGVVAMRATPVDALPDTSDIAVIVVADAPGLPPDLVDDQVTHPLSTALLATPGASVVRGFSAFGRSTVHVLFDDGTDRYWARARVSETLDVAAGSLPAGVVARLGPDATGVGWVFQYVLLDAGPEARALRAALDGDGDGAVSDAELPHPQAFTILDGRGVSVYAAARLDGLLARGGRSAPDAARLVRAFDRDGDGALSRPELAGAVAFDGLSLGDLRALQEDLLRTELAAVDGVAEIATVGGFAKEVQVEVDPARMEALGVGLGDVVRAVRGANDLAGAGVIEVSESAYMVRADGRARSLEALEVAPVRVDPASHLPVRLDQVATVQWGPSPRRGLTDWNGEGDVVSGIVVMRPDANALTVIDGVRRRLDALGASLPPGVFVEVAYDRAPLVRRAIATLATRLAEEIALVALVCAAILLRLRSALVPMVALPLGVLATFLGMRAVGLRADVMSLGGIAIAVGVMVDASLVLVENVHKRAERHPDEAPVDRVIAACTEVGPAIFQSLLIVTLSFVPVFALERAEGRLFRPLAWTKTLAMGSASVIAITVVPALLVSVARGRFRAEGEHPVSRALVWVYGPLLDWMLDRPRLVIGVAAVCALSAVWPASRLAREFMPPLEEGDVLYMPTTPPGLGSTRARALLQQTDRLIASHPQVATVLGKAGRADTATDPAPLSMFETVIQLTPPETWPAGKTFDDIVRELDARVDVPGLVDGWTMPIRARLDMLSTGIRTPVGVKLLGDDLDTLGALARQVEAVLRDRPGVTGVYAERVTGGNYVDVVVDREAASRWGLSVADVQGAVRTAVGGSVVTEWFDGLSRFDVTVRYPRALRDDPDAVRQMRLSTPLGHTVALGAVADVRLAKGPPMVKREDGRRTAWVMVDVDTPDLPGWVAQAQEVVAARVPMPPGVSVVWAGQAASWARAQARLAWIVPLALGLVVVLLQAHFRDLAVTVLLVGSVLAFAPLGGLWLLYAASWPISVATAVGFLALIGLAAETGVVMIVYLEAAWADARAQGAVDLDALRAATRAGAVDRVRPKVLTVATTLLGLLPVMVGGGTGASAMQRIAAPMVGGLVSSTVLTLAVVPVGWFLWRRRGLG